MSWTANKLTKTFAVGQVTVRVAFTNDITLETFTEDYHTPLPTGIWPDDLIQARLNQIRAVAAALALISLGTTLQTPPAQTQAQIDQANFLVLVQNYRQLKAQLAGALAGTVQADVDNAATLIRTAYLPAYGAFIIGLF